MKRPIWRDGLGYSAAALQHRPVLYLCLLDRADSKMHEYRKDQAPQPHAPFLKWLLTYVYEIPKFIKRYQVTLDIRYTPSAFFTRGHEQYEGQILIPYCK